MGRRCSAYLVLALAAVAVVAGGCGGGSGGSGGEGEFEFSSGDSGHWAEVWCEINGSMTREEAIELMGEPSQEYDASSGFEPQSIWETGTMEYTLFYDSSGHVNSAMVVLRSGSNPTSCADNREF